MLYQKKRYIIERYVYLLYTATPPFIFLDVFVRITNLFLCGATTFFSCCATSADQYTMARLKK